MTTFGDKTPAGSSIGDWQARPPADAAREFRSRLAALPASLQRAAVAWSKPVTDLAVALRAAPSGPLHGVPFAIKDLFDLSGAPTFAGSTFLPEVRPTPAQASALVRRFHQLGAAPAAKTHLVEFASGLTGENPHYGDCPHPRFPDRLTGGSSSGSAALVAAGVVPLALGTDTGGSVRVPASWCGLYGFRLTPHDDFIRDAFPLAPTMDTAGWFTGNAADMLLSWRAFCGTPPSTGTARGCFIPFRAMLPDSDEALAGACDAAAREICAPADATTQASLLDAWRESVDAYLGIGMTEAFAVHREWLQPFKERYDQVIWQRFTDAGTWPQQRVIRSRAILESVRLNFAEYFRSFDFLVLPAVPAPAPRKADATPELRKNILTLTAPASLGGLPCLTVPVPLGDGLTAGLQIIVPRPDSPAVAQILRSE